MPYLMPNGKWRGKRMICGKIKTKTFPTKQEAKKWEAAQDAATWAKEENSTTPTVCLLDLANAYLDMAKERFSPKTVSEKALAFRYLFKTASAKTNPDDFTPRMALEALRHVAVKSSGHAANKARKNLAAAWEWGKKYLNLPMINPFHAVDKFPADKKPRYVPPESDFWRVYAVASEEDRVFLLTLLHTAARRTELFRLKWSDVDLVERKIRLGTRKTADGSMEWSWIPMTKMLHDALFKYRTQSRSIYVFTRDTGEQYTSRQHYMGRLCARAGVKPFGFHAIRHLAATILAYGGLDIPSIQAILRHHSPNTTALYIQSLGVQPDKLESIFGKREAASKVVPFKAAQKVIGA